MHHQTLETAKEYPIHVLFLEPLPSDCVEGNRGAREEPWLNRATAALGGRVHGRGFCHVEICIPDLQPADRGGGMLGYRYMSSSIYNGETVSVVATKTFSNPGYLVHTLSVTGAQLRRISDFIHDCKRREVCFDSVGMYLSMLPVQVWYGGESRTFCSKYVTQALQAAGGVVQVEGLNPNIVSPSKLYRALVENPFQPRSQRKAEEILFSDPDPITRHRPSGNSAYQQTQKQGRTLFQYSILGGDQHGGKGAARRGQSGASSAAQTPGIVGTVGSRLLELKKHADVAIWKASSP